MLRIRQEKHLARHLGLDIPGLRSLADSAPTHCKVLLVIDPAKPGKDRPVLDVHGELRRVQRRIYKRILLPHLEPSDYSFGGVRGRHIKMNAEQHLRSKFAFSCDISSFYPSIHSSKVYRFFAKTNQCSPDVARLLTRLCTHNYHLALGLITSPLIADQILKPIDKRIARMAEMSNLVYSRYVDDITLSGPFDLARSGFPKTIRRALETNGLLTNAAKDQFGRIGDPELLITKLRINRGRIDVGMKYLDELCRSLRDLQSLGRGSDFVGPYYTSGQIWGRVQFVSWVNPRRRHHLRKLYSGVAWKKVVQEADARGLVAAHKALVPAG